MTPLEHRGSFFVRDIGAAQDTLPVERLFFIDSKNEACVELFTGSNGTGVVCTTKGAAPVTRRTEGPAQALRVAASLLDGNLTTAAFAAGMPLPQFIRIGRASTGIEGDGQFFVKIPELWTLPIPVDNFLFIADDSTEIRVSGVGDFAALVNYLPPGEKSRKSVWLDSYAQALHVMAGVLEGSIPFEQFVDDNLDNTNAEHQFWHNFLERDAQ